MCREFLAVYCCAMLSFGLFRDFLSSLLAAQQQGPALYLATTGATSTTRRTGVALGSGGATTTFARASIVLIRGDATITKAGVVLVGRGSTATTTRTGVVLSMTDGATPTTTKTGVVLSSGGAATTPFVLGGSATTITRASVVLIVSNDDPIHPNLLLLLFGLI
jgi:hypothetical protein